FHVTGVQTCALPIWGADPAVGQAEVPEPVARGGVLRREPGDRAGDRPREAGKAPPGRCAAGGEPGGEAEDRDPARRRKAEAGGPELVLDDDQGGRPGGVEEARDGRPVVMRGEAHGGRGQGPALHEVAAAEAV